MAHAQDAEPSVLDYACATHFSHNTAKILLKTMQPCNKSQIVAVLLKLSTFTFMLLSFALWRQISQI
jgi:hypothetical protein